MPERVQLNIVLVLDKASYERFQEAVKEDGADPQDFVSDALTQYIKHGRKLREGFRCFYQRGEEIIDADEVYLTKEPPK